MKAKPYPLALLARLRDAKTDEAARTLATKIRAREDAAALEDAARQQKARAERDATTSRRVEANALAEGALRAADLQRAGAWEFGVQRLAEDDARAVAHAEAKRADAARIEEDARAAVTTRRAESEVVTADEARFRSAERRRSEKKDEDAAEDAWRPRRP